MEPPFTSYSEYLRQTYGEKTYRVSVDGGFSCPKGAEGERCAFCSEEAARAPYLGTAEGMREQVEKGVRFLHARYAAGAFLLYFQASCATNAPAAELARIYGSALALAPFRGLSVGTRPDCIDDEKADLLSSYLKPGFDVWVELGLQSASDRTLAAVRRGHTRADFLRAYHACRGRGLKVAVHLIFGLPGESARDMEDTVRFVAGLDPDGVKLHNLHVPQTAPFASELPKGELTVPGPLSHLEYVISALELLPPRTVIMRLTTDTPRDRLLAPRGFWDKQTFQSRLISEMISRGARQGRRFTPAQ